MAVSSTFMPLLSVFGNLPPSRSAVNSKSVSNLPSRRSAISPGFKIVATRCSNEKNVSSDATPEVKQHFHPSVWDGYDFTSASKSHLIDEGRLKELKKEVKNMISLVDAADSFQELDLVDKIQRLGVAYHFKDEIECILQRTYNDDYTHFFDQNIRKDDNVDLCYVSLRFRLLRQAGYYVSTDVFKKFTDDEKCEFRGNLASDVQAMLSLYEASYLSFRGEDIMDEAMNFSTKHLNSMLSCLSLPLVLQVQHALSMPLQRSPERVYARHYISIYQKDICCNKTLLEFAKLDYNFVQLLHQKEINEVQQWWERIDVRSKLRCSDFRVRVVEAYAILNSIYFEPQYSQGRIHLAKLWIVLSVVDDAYDVFGSLDELELLCDAFQRWDVNSTIELSNRMRVIFHEVMNLFNEIEGDMIKGGNVVGVSSLKEGFQAHTKNLLEEVKVILSGKVPTLEDWLLLSVPTVFCSAFVILSTMNAREVATKEVFDWIATMPKMIKYSDLLNRLTGDIASLKVEQERGTNCNSVLCYMMDHGVSESEAIESLQKINSSIWKIINEECLRVHPVPIRVIKNLLNLDRCGTVYYAGADGHTISDGRTKEIITSIFVNPIPI